MSQQLDQPVTIERDAGLAVDELTHAVAGTAVLDAVSLQIRTGEVLVIIGPSGTGKTTLLELLAMFEPPDAGTVRIGDADVWALPRDERLIRRRQLAMVFQQPNLFAASVKRNVEYGLHIRQSWRNRLRSWIGRLEGQQTAQRIERALATVGMDDRLDQSATSLSGGEAQRVAFARALAVDPDFLLLDEPTSDLDPRNTAVIEAAIRTARDQGLGVAIATHDMHQAERIADRVAVMINGEIIELGPPEQVFETPTDPRARKFIDGELVY